MAMIEIHPGAGTTIDRACERLVKSAPAFMLFNDIRIEADPGDTASDLVAEYHAKSDQRRKVYMESPEYKQRQIESAKREAEENRLRDETLASITRSGVRAKYPWTDDLGEISGFGGGYESACRDMVYAGLAWLDQHPGADLKAKTFQNVYGILSAESDDAKALEKAMTSACPDCSGAMHQATMSICMWIAKNGWDAFVAARTKRS